MIKSTYEAIRNSPLWESSLLIITYDEHGGFYDHVPPPAAVAPGDTVPHSKYNQYGFDFTVYGLRVPAIVVSAYTPKNTISHQLYDHASVPATLETLFNMPPLTQRDAAANNVTSLAALPTARTDTPATLPAPAAIAVAQVAAMRGMQPPPKKDSDPVDGGNLPGFLHVVRKSQLNKAPEATRGLIMEKMATDIQTRGQAKTYLETTLAGLFGAEL